MKILKNEGEKKTAAATTNIQNFIEQNHIKSIFWNQIDIGVERSAGDHDDGI